MSEKFTYQSNYIPTVKEIVVETKEDNCSCVKFVRQFLNVPYGDAIDLEPNSNPVVGGAVLFDYDEVGHIAVIISLEGDGFIVRESNYKPCEETIRLVKYDDKAIKGFFNSTLKTN